MPVPPARKRTRSTVGSRKLAAYVEENGLRPVSVYVPEKLHRALSEVAIAADFPLQGLITVACTTFYDQDPPVVPPLLAPTRIKQDPHKNVTWYADAALHKKIKLLALHLDGTVQQLVLSAVVERWKEAGPVKALHLESGHAPYARAPVGGAPALALETV